MPSQTYKLYQVETVSYAIVSNWFLMPSQTCRSDQVETVSYDK